MKLASIFIINIITFAISATSKQEDENNSTAIILWQDGKVPYEISNQFGKNNFLKTFKNSFTILLNLIYLNIYRGFKFN